MANINGENINGENNDDLNQFAKMARDEMSKALKAICSEEEAKMFEHFFACDSAKRESFAKEYNASAKAEEEGFSFTQWVKDNPKKAAAIAAIIVGVGAGLGYHYLWKDGNPELPAPGTPPEDNPLFSNAPVNGESVPLQ